MTDLVDYLRDKLEHAQRGCTCPKADWLATLPMGMEVLSDCVDHGQKRQTVGGYGYMSIGRKRWWRR
jgi:hypothetical protein